MISRVHTLSIARFLSKTLITHVHCEFAHNYVCYLYFIVHSTVVTVCCNCVSTTAAKKGAILWVKHKRLKLTNSGGHTNLLLLRHNCNKSAQKIETREECATSHILLVVPARFGAHTIYRTNSYYR